MTDAGKRISRRSFMTLAGVPLLSAASVTGATSRPAARGAVHRTIDLDGRLVRIGAGQPTQELGTQGGSGRFATVFGSDSIATPTFQMLGLTWSANTNEGDPFRLTVRTRTTQGWSDWRELGPDQHGPDSQAERRNAREGTALVGVGTAAAVEVRVETVATPPAGLRAHMITYSQESTSGSSYQISSTSSSISGAPTPTILTRADWGADESIREPGDPLYGEIRGMFVHHTAGTNDYSSSEVPGLIDGIYRYHVEGRGWRDIGYNFLIDKFGRIWEGRYGGITKAVVGAHTRGYNSYTFGAAVLGDHVSTAVSEDALRAYRDLIAWKFHANGVWPKDSVSYPEKTLPAVSGHRDGGATECPGQLLYDKLPQLRDETAIIMIQTQALPSLPGPVHPRLNRP